MRRHERNITMTAKSQVNFRKRPMNSNDWKNSAYADQFFKSERPFLSAGLRQAVGPKTLQIADLIDPRVVTELDLPFYVTAHTDSTQHGETSNLLVDPAFLPFAPDSLSTVILPHVLEWHTLPHQVLREVQRVLMSDGHIVLTGFNPASLIGLQRLLSPRAVFKGHYYSSKRVVDWLQLLGFEVVASSIFQYAPLSKRLRLRKAFAFLEKVGGRWLPMLGGGYVLVAKKREIGVHLVGRGSFRARKPKLTSASAKASFKRKQL